MVHLPMLLQQLQHWVVMWNLAAKVGNDPFGKHLIDEMQDFGVSTKYMLQDDHYFTTFAFVSLMEDGERDFYFNRGADGQLSRSRYDAINLDEYFHYSFWIGYCFFTRPIAGSLSKPVTKSAAEKNIFISFDPNYRHLLFKNNTRPLLTNPGIFYNCCHFFKLSDEEAMLITGAATLTGCSSHIYWKKPMLLFAITLGKEGTMLGL